MRSFGKQTYPIMLSYDPETFSTRPSGYDDSAQSDLAVDGHALVDLSFVHNGDRQNGLASLLSTRARR
jgi:hypothetical protein